MPEKFDSDAPLSRRLTVLRRERLADGVLVMVQPKLVAGP